MFVGVMMPLRVLALVLLAAFAVWAFRRYPRVSAAVAVPLVVGLLVHFAAQGDAGADVWLRAAGELAVLAVIFVAVAWVARRLGGAAEDAAAKWSRDDEEGR